MNDKKPEDKHISVLLDELVDAIEIFQNKKNIIVDCTLGMGGHASKIIEKLNPGDTFIGFDADMRNLVQAKARLESINGENKIELIFIHSNFVDLKNQLEKHNITSITGIYYDLGISSLHVDEAERGFSFKHDGPLDMRFDTQSGVPASTIVNSYQELELIRIFKEYGEEPMSKQIANAIVQQRKKSKFTTTQQLSDLIGENSKIPKSRTRIFQALRIETNHELDVIRTSLTDAINLLDTNGSLFVISFHSLEDRIVKQLFKRESKDCICSDFICSCHHKKKVRITTKKPILPTDKEVKSNPRSRSAKARGVKKL